jgi:hypothetical protein
LLSGSAAVTIEFWATFGVNGNWARVFDFGNISGSSGQNFLFYTPHNATAGQTLGFSTAAATANLNPAGTLDNRAVHVVCILDPTNNYAAIYTNGVLESALTGPLPAFSGISTAWSFIGRSLFSADAWLNASIDELRIYDGRLTPQEITANDQSGPDALEVPVTLLASSSAAGLTLSWPSWADGFTLQASRDLTSGVWTPVAQQPTLANNQWLLNLAPTNSAMFYRLQR